MIGRLLIREPVQVPLPLGLKIGISVWGDKRFWATLSNDQVTINCACGTTHVVGAQVFASLPISRRHK